MKFWLVSGSNLLVSVGASRICHLMIEQGLQQLAFSGLLWTNENSIIIEDTLPTQF
jgi:hypothetical protein